MQLWSTEELVALFGKVKVGLMRGNTTTHDEDYVRDASSKVGPCPRDIMHYIWSPNARLCGLTALIQKMDQPQIIRTLQKEVLANGASDKVTLVIRVGPVRTTAPDDDRYVVRFKSRLIYNKMLDCVERLQKEEKWYSLCKSMGSLGPSLAGFLFEALAIRCTSGNFPTNNHTPFRDFVQMTKVENKSKAMPIRFVYRGNDARILVKTSGNQILFRIFPRGVLPAVTDHTTLVPPWMGTTRKCVMYDKIEDIKVDFSSYYSPRCHDNPLFDGFCFSFKDGKAVLWILQMTTVRMHGGVRSGFDLVSSLWKHASEVWKQYLVEIKFVLVVPHVDSTCHVEWNFDAEFGNHMGEVYVQFLDVSSFQWERGTIIADILGVYPEEVEEAAMVEAAT
ncbi:hypothetical protein BJV74DRAFT_136027 [Russula compacta]|nr:hypothetical protein BJV74DRAFT_136027 [Russula compacta]